MSKSRVSTGIRIMDELFQGGMVRGSSILLRAHPLVDVLSPALQLMHFRLEQGDMGLYFVNNKSPLSVVEESASVGLSVRRFKSEGKLDFVDTYSGLFGLRSAERFYVEAPSDALLVSDVVSKALVEKSRQGRVFLVFDNLNTSIDQCGERVLAAVDNWNRIGLATDSILCYIYADWGYPTEISEKVYGLFPNVVDVKMLERMIASHVLTIAKADGKPVETRIVPIKWVALGGVMGYIPKILVTGPLHAGKTTLVHTLSTRAVSVQRMGTTVALDFGHVTFRGFALDLFGTIGHSRFDPVLKHLGGEALGVILVLDSTKPEEFPRAKEMMQKAGVYGLPYVVAANKQDLSEALSVEEVRKKMRVPEEVDIIGTVAMNKDSSLSVLDALLDKLILK